MQKDQQPRNDHSKPGNTSKKYIITCMIASMLMINLQSQNLIPNPGFEAYKFLPCSCMQKSVDSYVKGWERVGAGTPDYITSLAAGNCYANPHSNDWESCGAQAPHKGNAMGMIMTYAKDGTYREYMGIRLKQPLEKGKTYYAEFYVSLGDHCGIATNNIGMLFLPGRYVNNRDYIIEETPQVNNVQVIDNTSGWTKVSGTFVAEDDMTYMIVGNFLPADRTHKKNMSSSQSYHADVAAYYIDDFLVYDLHKRLVVSKDTLVDSNATVNLFAMGGGNYEWIDAKSRKTLSEDDNVSLTIQDDRTLVCYSGRDTNRINVRMRRPANDIKGRTIKKSQKFDVTHDEIQVEIYDKLEVDGDIISLYHDQALIASNVTISKDTLVYKINIDRTRPNHIITFAENEGASPPNTASIIIRDGDKVTEITLTSDLTTCDAVILNYKDEDE
jgi:hypothetical protein